MNELKELAEGYIRLISGALAIRSKASPSEKSQYDPLAAAMAKCVRCVRNPETTKEQYYEALQDASSWWDEWYRRQTRAEERDAR